MKLRYNGKTENYSYLGHEFKDGVCDVPKTLAEKLLAESPRTFSVEPVAEKPEKKDPA